MPPGRARIVAFAGVALAAALFALRSRPAPPRPNIVLIVLDTVRADHLPVYGYHRDTAPFLTELASRAVVFERAYSTAGWTAPAMASLFTSVYPFQHGVIWEAKRKLAGNLEFNPLPSALETLPETLRRAGYATFGVSDNLNVSPLIGFDRGFDRFESATDASAEVIGKRVKGWQGEMHARRPYFLFIQYMDAHSPYQPKGPWFDEFMDDGKGAAFQPHVVASYDSEIRYLDGKLRGLSETLGWSKNTLVIVTSDHGEEFGDHGDGGHAHSLYDELLRVPLIVSWAGGGIPPRRERAMVGHVDLLPTLRAVAGLAASDKDMGTSLVPLLRDARRHMAGRTLFAHLVPLTSQTVTKAALDGRWKAIWTTEGNDELFDMEKDPLETKNVRREFPEEAARLRRAYEAAEQTAPRYADAPVQRKVDPATEERLKALGYLR